MRRWWKSFVRGWRHGFHHGRAAATGGFCGYCTARGVMIRFNMQQELLPRGFIPYGPLEPPL